MHWDPGGGYPSLRSAKETTPTPKTFVVLAPNAAKHAAVFYPEYYISHANGIERLTKIWSIPMDVPSTDVILPPAMCSWEAK